MRLDDSLELTYCTNIHPASGWPAVLASIGEYGPRLKAALSPDAPFGLGLRLSASEAAELRDAAQLAAFLEFLEREGLYVALINGFPYGSFHGTPVKEQVFAPDWRSAERLAYTTNLADILAAVMPPWSEGGVSTAPLSYKAWLPSADAAAWEPILRNLLSCANHLAELYERTGRYVHLDIEPEPDGLVETAGEFVRFFERLLRFAPKAAERQIREHITACYDICHMAVEFEDPGASLELLEAAGIRVGRVQVSSALCVSIPREDAARESLRRGLSSFADPVYLHQVIGRTAQGEAQKYSDLPQALEHLGRGAGGEWRIHFHVPLFLREYGIFGSTQEVIIAVLRRLKQRRFTRHLEIETYTWSVLPAGLKQELGSLIEREYRWVLSQLCEKP